MNIKAIPIITVQTTDMKLLEKVEELTQQLIEQQKRISQLEVQVEKSF